MKVALGIAAALTGLYAASSGMLFAFVGTVFLSPLYFSVFAGLCLLSVCLVHRFFEPMVPAITNTTMRAGQWFFCTAAVLRNVDLCATLLLYWLVARVVFVALVGLIPNKVAALWMFLDDLCDRNPDRPRDTLPAHAHQEVPAGSIPSRALANPIKKATEPERCKAFEELGNENSRKALNELYGELTEHPEKYAGRLRNPKDVFHQARSLHKTK